MTSLLDKIQALEERKRERTKDLSKVIPKRFKPEEEIFIQEYINSPTTSVVDIVKAVYPDIKSPKAKAKTLSSRDDIAYEIHRRQEILKYKVTYTQSDIIDRLWIEAKDSESSNATARINALQLLGKHIGMFAPENSAAKKKGGTTINVISYSKETEDKEIIQEVPQISVEDTKGEETQEKTDSQLFRTLDYSEFKDTSTKETINPSLGLEGKDYGDN